MKTAAAPLLMVALLLAACSSPQSATKPSPASRPPASPSSSLGPSPIATPSSDPSSPLSLSAIQRLNSRVGYIAGWAGSGLGLAKTSDDGATWQRIVVPASYLTALRFIDEQVGWVGGFAGRDVPQIGCQQAAPLPAKPCRGVVLRTQDGGLTWQTSLEVPTGDGGNEPIEQIQAVDGARAWALTLSPAPCGPDPCQSDLRRTTDGGQTWTTLLHGWISAIRFATSSRGWIAVGDSSGNAAEIRMTSDGGTTWRSVFRTSSGAPFALDAATISRAWLLTRNGGYCTSSSCLRYELFRTDNGGLTWFSLGNPKDKAPGCAFGHFVGPLFASASQGFLGLNAGAGGFDGGPLKFLSTQDGGRTWKCATTPHDTKFISAADPWHVWASSNDRATQATTLYATEDGGASWHTRRLSDLR